jgi:hypothetical protein
LSVESNSQLLASSRVQANTKEIKFLGNEIRPTKTINGLWKKNLDKKKMLLEEQFFLIYYIVMRLLNDSFELLRLVSRLLVTLTNRNIFCNFEKFKIETPYFYRET